MFHAGLFNARQQNVYNPTQKMLEQVCKGEILLSLVYIRLSKTPRSKHRVCFPRRDVETFIYIMGTNLDVIHRVKGTFISGNF